MVVALFTILFAFFPLTDTDIWWHLACAREWVTTWTPVRSPVVNVHEYFQAVVAFVYGLGGAPLLVAFKAILWGIVFALFGRGKRQSLVAVALLFIFRYHFEIRPVLFSLLFLGIYWNVLPSLFEKFHCESRRGAAISRCCSVTLILTIQWFWCKCQGLYILGPLFALLVLLGFIWNSRKANEKISPKSVAWRIAFVVALFVMPFLHGEGLSLFLYPFGLLDRLLGLTPSAAVFSSEIAENRSPLTLLMAGENALECVLMIALCVAGIFVGLRSLRRHSGTTIGRDGIQNVALLVTAILALIAERNFVLFLPVLLAVLPYFSHSAFHISHFTFCRRLPTVYFLLPTFFILGLWARSLSAYDYSMVAYQRVPVDAAQWMLSHPHSGKLFNDDRAGGFLAFVNPSDSVYIDGRFILKSSEFFERYLSYAANPAQFMADADSLGIDRSIFPLRYYARWDTLLLALEKSPHWNLVYRDEYFAVFDKK
jgi:hypothetical protein